MIDAVPRVTVRLYHVQELLHIVSATLETASHIIPRLRDTALACRLRVQMVIHVCDGHATLSSHPLILGWGSSRDWHQFM